MKKINNRTFLIVHSSIYAIFAITLLFLPQVMWPVYGLQLNDKYAIFLSQHNSIFLGGIAILGFLFRDVEEGSKTAHKLFTGLMLTNILGVIITLYAALTEIFVGFGWSDPAFFLLMAVMSYIKLNNNK
ncbi:hypothetical protein [Ancylomarina euxinus]|uniref:hypothetical protein n=1 Tax=Ancylomarina euxinus TaxID=2283627 RepID=UPI001CDB865A|nr:hypothetical protein [Ancylomarina euxinus]MCZ4696483.1 hypothetical protein [Ancylomarina euxinus]